MMLTWIGVVAPAGPFLLKWGQLQAQLEAGFGFGAFTESDVARSMSRLAGGD